MGKRIIQELFSKAKRETEENKTWWLISWGIAPGLRKAAYQIDFCGNESELETVKNCCASVGLKPCRAVHIAQNRMKWLLYQYRFGAYIEALHKGEALGLYEKTFNEKLSVITYEPFRN